MAGTGAGAGALVGWPRYMVLKSCHNNKYLTYIADDMPLQFSEDDPTSWRCKFKLEMAKTGGAYSIRCCLNNKYLLPDKDINGLVKAAATEKNEDPTQHSSTLFHLVYLEEGNVGIVYGSSMTGLTTQGGLPLFGVGGDAVFAAHILTDWESLVVLPKHSALKRNFGYYHTSSADISGSYEFSYDPEV